MTSLSSYVNDSAINLCLILTKRIANRSDPKGFSLYNKYFCAGKDSATLGYETWSRYAKTINLCSSCSSYV